MSEKKFVIYFGNEKKNYERISEVFADCSPVSFNEMQPTFDFLQSYYVEAIVFDTYQEESTMGINLMDLDVLLFYATSDSSMNKMIKFYPIDPVTRAEASAEQNVAEILYKNLYEKYLFLMQGQTYASLSTETIALPEGLDLLADLIGTLDDACEEMEKNLQSSRVSLESNTESSVVNGRSLTSTDNQLVSGGVDEFGEDDRLVKGQKKDLAEESILINGSAEEEQEGISANEYDTQNDESQIIEGNPEDLREDSIRVSGSPEEFTEDINRVEGAKEDLSEESNLIKGSKEDLTEDTNLIKGSKEDLTEESTLIGGSQDEVEKVTTISGEAKDLKEEAMLVKSLPSDEDDEKEKQVIKGAKEDLKTEFMKVKSIDSQTDENPEDDQETRGINQRNKLGQTPVMLFAKAGDIERTEDLIAKGADISLFCKEGKSVLHYACQNSGNIKLVTYLVEERNAKISKRDSSSKDPLYEATMSDSPEIVKYLLDNGARINTKVEGRTYLHIAAQKNKIQAFKVLLTYGANPQATDDKGQTVTQFCRLKKKINFLKVMEAVRRLKEKKAS